MSNYDLQRWKHKTKIFCFLKNPVMLLIMTEHISTIFTNALRMCIAHVSRASWLEIQQRLSRHVSPGEKFVFVVRTPPPAHSSLTTQRKMLTQGVFDAKFVFLIKSDSNIR